MDKTISQLKKEASEHEAQAKAIRRRMKEFWSDVDANIDEVILYINKSDKNNANMSDTFEQICKAYGAETEHKKTALRNHLLSEKQIDYFNRIYKPDAPISERGASGSNSVERVSSPVGVVGGTPAEVE